MENDDALKSEQTASSKAESGIESPGKMKSQEFATAVESHQQLEDISLKKDVKDNPDDLQSNKKAKIDQQISALRDKKTICYPPLKKRRKIKKHETVLANPDEIPRNVNFRRVEGQEKKEMSLRRRAIFTMTRKKLLLSEMERHESFKTRTDSQDPQNNTSKIASEGNEGRLTFVVKPTLKNETRDLPSSSNQSPEVSTDLKQPSGLASITPCASAAESQSSKVRTEKEVWSHFISCMRERESLNTSNTDGTGSVTPEADNCNREVSTSRGAISEPMLIFIQKFRVYLLNKAAHWEDVLKKVLEKSRRETNMEKKIKLFTEIKEFKAALYKYYTFLCDQQKFLTRLQETKTYPGLSNATSLMDLPMSEAHILTFTSLFLFLQKSLYSKIPIENIFKRMKWRNCLVAFDSHQSLKAIYEDERKTLEVDAVKCVLCFNDSLEECSLKMNHKIPDVETESLEDYQKHVNDLKIYINETYNSLNNLVSIGSLMVFPLLKYLCKSQLITFEKLLFLDKRRRNLFS